METTLMKSRSQIEGAYTFISMDDLASQLVEVYFDMKQLDESNTYRLYLSINFLDSNATRMLFRFLRILNACSAKPGFPKLKVTYLYDWKDEHMEDLGLFLAEQFADSLNLQQIEFAAA